MSQSKVLHELCISGIMYLFICLSFLMSLFELYSHSFVKNTEENIIEPDFKEREGKPDVECFRTSKLHHRAMFIREEG